jgi:class 3 adenylate cyclase
VGKQRRRLAAILAADVAGYSRLTGADEEGTLERLRALRREVIDPALAEHHGRLVKTTGPPLSRGRRQLVRDPRLILGQTFSRRYLSGLYPGFL